MSESLIFEILQELIAVERVNGYSRLNPEQNADGSRNSQFGWPSQGVIKFDNVSLKYRYELKILICDSSQQKCIANKTNLFAKTDPICSHHCEMWHSKHHHARRSELSGGRELANHP